MSGRGCRGIDRPGRALRVAPREEPPDRCRRCSVTERKEINEVVEIFVSMDVVFLINLQNTEERSVLSTISSGVDGAPRP